MTTCGRRIEVRGLRLGSPERPVGRIALDVGEDRGGEPGTWAALTAEEARRLAHLLLEQAGPGERDAAPLYACGDGELRLL
ncbi:hypothetical protein ACGFYV_05845 [Streptomyces sp. NPDC048297]|uniref:hypothetical protein n=1 Tax=Streptomyces sp. NPDC048297 TaxID=3365531 RepID=UPI003723E459